MAGPLMTRDRFEGCLFGLALGDALGAPLEGGALERLLWRLLGTTRAGERRWTDDTQMSLDLAESLLARGALELDDLAQRFARSYRWSRGYGPGAAKLLRRIAAGADWREANRSVFPDGSFGNGGAMRAPVIGLWYGRRLDELAQAARLSASVTHAHPLGMQGAALIATATAHALLGHDRGTILSAVDAICESSVLRARLEFASDWLASEETPTLPELRNRLGNGIAASESCISALYLALSHLEEPFVELLRVVGLLGGDVDTIGAMAGAIWGAANGVARLPRDELKRLEQRERIARVAAALCEHARH